MPQKKTCDRGHASPKPARLYRDSLKAISELAFQLTHWKKKEKKKVCTSVLSHLLYSLTILLFRSVSLSDDSNPSLSKDISSVLSAVPECLDSEGVFPLEDELRIEPLSLDGLSMLSDPDMVLPDPSVEDSFRSDRL